MAYGALANIIRCPGAVSDSARKQANLVAFCDRLAARYWQGAPAASARAA